MRTCGFVRRHRCKFDPLLMMRGYVPHEYLIGVRIAPEPGQFAITDSEQGENPQGDDTCDRPGIQVEEILVP